MVACVVGEGDTRSGLLSVGLTVCSVPSLRPDLLALELVDLPLLGVQMSVMYSGFLHYSEMLQIEVRPKGIERIDQQLSTYPGLRFGGLGRPAATLAAFRRPRRRFRGLGIPRGAAGVRRHDLALRAKPPDERPPFGRSCHAAILFRPGNNGELAPVVVEAVNRERGIGKLSLGTAGRAVGPLLRAHAEADAEGDGHEGHGGKCKLDPLSVRHDGVD